MNMVDLVVFYEIRCLGFALRQVSEEVGLKNMNVCVFPLVEFSGLEN